MGEGAARKTATKRRRQSQGMARAPTDGRNDPLLIDLPGPTRSCQIGEREASVKAASPRSGSSAARALREAEASRTIARRVGPRWRPGESPAELDDARENSACVVLAFTCATIVGRLVHSENLAAGEAVDNPRWLNEFLSGNGPLPAANLLTRNSRKFLRSKEFAAGN